MKTSKPIKDSSFAIYGLGLSGSSVLKFLRKKNIKKFYTWDDKKIKIIKINIIHLKKH